MRGAESFLSYATFTFLSFPKRTPYHLILKVPDKYWLRLCALFLQVDGKS